MDIKKISGCIGRVAELVQGWETRESADPLERELALEILRAIYAELRFDDHTVECSVNPAPEPQIAPNLQYSPPTGPAGSFPAQLPDPEPEPEVVPPQHRTQPAFAQEEAESTENTDSVVPPTPAVQRRVDPDVIRSLYGDAGPAPGQKTAAPATEPADRPEGHPVGEEQQTRSDAVRSSQPATLGDVMNGNRQTLGETLQNGVQDMAAKIAAAERPDLRQSIGLNDKFLMIRDMFEGDANAFNEAIAHLDTFTDLDDAIIYIHETYNWSAESDGVKLLVELLERKLG